MLLKTNAPLQKFRILFVVILIYCSCMIKLFYFSNGFHSINLILIDCLILEYLHCN